MKIYLQPQTNQVENLIYTLAEMGLINVHAALVIEPAQIDQADILTRLLAIIEQPFDVIHPLNVSAETLAGFTLTEMGKRPDGYPVDGAGWIVAAADPTPELVAVDLAAPDAGDPSATLLVRTCEHCGEAWNPKRKDSRFCLSPECQHAKKDEIKTRYGHKARAERVQAAQAEIDQKPVKLITNDELDNLFPGMHLADGADAPDVVESPVRKPAPASEEPESLAMLGSGPKVWQVEDGTHKGERLSSDDVISALAKGYLKQGKHLRHEKAGRCPIVRLTHGRGLGLRRDYGEGSPCAVNFSDPLYA